MERPGSSVSRAFILLPPDRLFAAWGGCFVGNSRMEPKDQDMKSKKGFTLIELLVVIAIIALLLAILVPSLNKAKEKAREVICRVHLKGIGLGLTIYIDENNNKVYPNVPNRFLWYDSAGNYLRPDHPDAYWGLAYS